MRGAPRRGLATLAGAAVLVACADPPPDRPDIVLLMIDTLRADRVGAYGGARSVTPHIDALAADGVLFERAIAPAPWTQPSIASIFAARFPSVHGVVGRSGDRMARLDDSVETLAERLRSAGYATAAFVANSYLEADFGFAQGFDHYDATLAQPVAPAPSVGEAALDWLDDRQASGVPAPLFLYLHFMDVHGPYDADHEFVAPLLEGLQQRGDRRRLTPREQRALGYLATPPADPLNLERDEGLAVYWEYWDARYQAGVNQLDRDLGELVSALWKRGHLDDAYVILAADHGEALAEDGRWGHGWSTRDAELHVPLVLYWPDRLPRGRRVSATVSLIDLLPTLVDQLGLARDSGAQGRSLVPLIEGAEPARARAVFAESVAYGPDQQAIYLDGWKLIETPTRARRQLFQQAGDAAEQRDLAGAEPERVRALSERLAQWRSANAARAAQTRRASVPLPPETREALRALGYLE